MEREIKIGVIGLGYVGLPLACLFATKYQVVGLDLKQSRVDELNGGVDSTNEVTPERLQKALATGLTCTTDAQMLATCNVYVVTVPTPVDEHNVPDLSPLEGASKTVGKFVKKDDVVIFESTVYPGVTEDFCAPHIEKVSGLKANVDFFLGYSPERINPGDKEHTVEKIRKITSGSTPETADFVDKLYNSVLQNGTHRAPTIKVAEAAKVLENTQRDVNIALMNEMAKLLNAMGVDISDVLDAAGSKWNFLRFTPGLVGGHCISVDPYYLISESKAKGIYPRLITEARRINDSMSQYVVERVIKCMNMHDTAIHNANILILGFTFKENCPDIRNSKVVDIYHHLVSYTPNVQVYDPWVDVESAKREYGIYVDTEAESLKHGSYDAVIYCVKHREFDGMDLKSLCRPQGIIFDMKSNLPREVITERL